MLYASTRDRRFQGSNSIDTGLLSMLTISFKIVFRTNSKSRNDLKADLDVQKMTLASIATPVTCLTIAAGFPC